MMDRFGTAILTHSYAGYSRGCRCETCTAAKREYIRARRSRAAARRQLVEGGGGRHYVDGIEHGYAGYQDFHCRCDTCRAAKAERMRRAAS